MSAPAQDSTERLFAPAGLAAELDVLADTIRAVHPRPDVIPLVGSAGDRAALERSLVSPMRRLDFALRLAPLVNDSPDGHTFLPLPAEEFRRWDERGDRWFPWDLDFAGGRAFVAVSHAPGEGAAVGDEVLAVNGVPVPELVARLLPCVNGETPIRRFLALRYALCWLLKAAFGFDGPFTLTLGGGAGTVQHAGVSDAELRAGRGWDQDGPPPYEYRSYRDEGLGVVDFREFSDPERFAGFLDETFDAVRREGIRNLVVDLRGNDGGNSVLGDMLLGYVADRPLAQFARREVKVSRHVKELYRGPQAERKRYDPEYDRIVAAPEGSLLTLPGLPAALQPPERRFVGDLYVLIGPATYSSATMLASAVKDHRLGVLVGEETGGSATQYGDFCPFTLPRTGLQALVSHKWFLRPSGVDDGRGVLPDVEVPAGAALAEARAIVAGTAAG